jgi:hypothetical protein
MGREEGREWCSGRKENAKYSMYHNMTVRGGRGEVLLTL